MSDVLSQSQIDALLSAAQAGTLEEEVTEEKKVRKYDFHTPKKFTKDRLKLISGVYENYARLVASHLTSIMRMDIEVELLAVEEQRYYEFNNALSEDDIIAFINAKFVDHEEEEIMDPVFFQLSIQIIHGFVDRMLGGTGDDDPSSDDPTITEVEMVLYENLLTKIAPVMDSVWEVYVDSHFTYSRIETNPRLVQAIGMDEIVVIVAFSIRINEIYGQMNVCLPGSILEYIFKKIEESSNLLNRKKELQTEEDRESIFQRIEESELEVVAHMDYVYMLLQDIFSMQPGDILNLGIPKNSTITLDVGGTQWFKGKMGVFRDNKAVKIERVLDHKDPLEEESELYFEVMETLQKEKNGQNEGTDAASGTATDERL
ncbi:MAG: flagellar motor switch protein FliM [Anaerovoracaceae bacterium]